jgi:hypothetical protein
MVNDAKRLAAGPGGHTGATTESSATDLNPTIGSSGKSLPEPTTADPTPVAAIQPIRPSSRPGSPTPSINAGPQPRSSAVCLSAARTRRTLIKRGNDLDTEWSHERAFGGSIDVMQQSTEKLMSPDCVGS